MMPKMIEAGYPKPFVIVLAASAALLEAFNSTIQCCTLL